MADNEGSGVRTPRRTLLVAGSAALLGGLSGCIAIAADRNAEETATETVDPEGVDDVTLTTDVADAAVRGEDRADIHVEAVKRAPGEDGLDLLELDVERNGGTVAVTARRSDDNLLRLGPGPTMDVTVTVPEGVPVTRTATNTGDADVRGVDGPATVRTDTGDLRVADVRGDLTARTDTGDQEISGVDGAVSARSATGEVAVRQSATVDDLRANTGDVTAEIPSLSRDAEVRTDTGDLALSLSRSLDADVTASTNTGEITADGFDDSETETETTFVAELGDGTHALRVTTDTGDVQLDVTE